MKPSLFLSATAFAFFSLPGLAGAQPSERIFIVGTVHDKEAPQTVLNELMVVNKTTQHGFFGKGDGTFQTDAGRADTLIIGATGYATLKISFADSLQKDTFQIALQLRRLSITLKEVKVFSPRDLDEIQKDIQKLGYDKHDYQLSGVDAFSSPITFLYQECSRLERLKRHNRERINEEKKRLLLKELFQRFVAWEIIDLDDTEFDRFVEFCNVPEDFMKSSTQYDFIEYVKGKFFMFRAMER